MSQAIIFESVLAMLLLTFVVWLWMFARRMSYLLSHKIDAESLKSPEQVSEVLPEVAAAPGNNFKNLFEMPVVFYLVCVAAFALNQVDQVLLNCAWAYVALRAVHSVVHCTYNRVLHRFIAYLASSVVVWFMVLKVSWAVL
ncbi:MAG: MAPEG family protein [Cellvibrionaceae bacterium]